VSLKDAISMEAHQDGGSCALKYCLFRSDANLQPCWQAFSVSIFFFCLLDVISLMSYVVLVAFLQKFSAHCTFSCAILIYDVTHYSKSE